MDWFRSWHGAPTDNKWLLIARRAGVVPGMVSALVWALLDHASQAEERGSVLNFDVETYCAFSGFEEADIRKVMKALSAKGIVDADGFLAAWDRRQPKREDPSAGERKRRERDRKKDNGSGGAVTQRHAMSRNVTHGHAPEEIRGEEIREEKRERVEVGGEGGAGGEGSAPDGAPTHPKARPLPIDFGLSPNLFQFGLREGLNDDDIRREFDRFSDHWRANGERKIDWQAAFRNWIRKARDLGNAGDAKPGRNRRRDGGLVAAYQRAVDSFHN